MGQTSFLENHIAIGMVALDEKTIGTRITSYACEKMRKWDLFLFWDIVHEIWQMSLVMDMSIYPFAVSLFILILNKTIIFLKSDHCFLEIYFYKVHCQKWLS